MKKGEITAVLFDLDGTLLPMDQEIFAKVYIGGLAGLAGTLGCDAKMLASAIMAGTVAMTKNDGKRTNEEVFWDTLVGMCGEEARGDMTVYGEFYKTEFQNVRNVCGFSPKAREVLDLLKSKGMRTALATNPLFPPMATESRIRWAGLSVDDFELYTSYETSHYCKPSLDYYREILDRLSLNAEECLMVGNDVGEDMVARELGMKVFLLTDCMINRKNEDISVYPHGNFDELIAFLEKI